MDKSTLLLMAIVLAVFGTSVAAGRPSWGIFTGIAIILLAAGLAAGALPMRSDDYFDERAGAGQRISKSLVTLSSLMATFSSKNARCRNPRLIKAGTRPGHRYWPVVTTLSVSRCG